MTFSHDDARRRRPRRTRQALRIAITTVLFVLIALAALRNASAAASRPNRAQVPASLQGLWLPATRQGDADCRRYRAAQTDSDVRWQAIVGGVALYRDRLRTLSEYGEGDFIVVRRIAAVSPNTWRIEGGMTIEGEEPDEARPVTVRIALAAGVLDWRYTVEGDTTHGRFRRCAAAP